MVRVASRGARQLTVEEWANLDDEIDGELVDGLLEEEEMPSAVHEMVVTWLAWVFRSWLGSRGGAVFGSEHKLIVGQRRGRKPDISVYLPGRPLPGQRAGATRRPPSIVGEILSPRPRDVRRDTVDKLADYAAFGVIYYWLVDPQARTIEVRRLDRGGRHVTMLSAADGSHAAPGCDGLTLDLDALWAEVDRLPDDEAD